MKAAIVAAMLALAASTPGCGSNCKCIAEGNGCPDGVCDGTTPTAPASSADGGDGGSESGSPSGGDGG